MMKSVAVLFMCLLYDTCLFSIVFHRFYCDIHASDNKSEQTHVKSHCGLILCPSRNSEVQCCMNLPFVRRIFLASLCWRSFIDLPLSLKYPKGVWVRAYISVISSLETLNFWQCALDFYHAGTCQFYQGSVDWESSHHHSCSPTSSHSYYSL